MRGLSRAVQYIVVVWAAVTLNFALPRLAPGDPVLYMFGGEGEGPPPEVLEQLRALYGLDQSVLVQYGRFWANILTGDLGLSVSQNRPVTEVLLEKLPWTLALVGTGVLVAAVFGALLGAWAAWRPRRPGSRLRDRATLITVLAIDSMPGFWIGMILIAVFAAQLGWFPSYGATQINAEGLDWLLAAAHRLVLPAATLAIASTGTFFLLARASMITVLGEPYIRLARAKGLSERRVALHHALRTAALPVYTNLALTLGAVISGAVVVETVFSYPGLGKLIHDAVTARDYPLLQGAFLVATLCIIGANLIADATYPLLDPRVRKQSQEVVHEHRD
ncbi:ABC transporter permease [Hoyosella sp. G463]|uniref:ABC transporter permease n=1 Tax=Lolliginicoccus lacisalsi TaxID=2742202 RepID=A0A927JA69_9ACTN|nr:ABC transporter permease [Lolliginicoccus lacisalsi]MBD8505155.1 ABC transporter permease [Lolliginicoccus lacisalsi]